MTLQITEGTKLLFVPYERRFAQPEWLTVTKIGRKWVFLGTEHWPQRYKAKKGSREVDGGDYSSPGTLWPSEGAYNEHLELQKTWREFHRQLGSSVTAPKGITKFDLEKAAAALGLNLNSVRDQ